MRDPFLPFSFPLFPFPPRNKRWEILHHFLLDFFLILFFLPVLSLSLFPIFSPHSFGQEHTPWTNIEKHRESSYFSHWIISSFSHSFFLRSCWTSNKFRVSWWRKYILFFTILFPFHSHFFFTSILVVREGREKGKRCKMHLNRIQQSGHFMSGKKERKEIRKILFSSRWKKENEKERKREAEKRRKGPNVHELREVGKETNYNGRNPIVSLLGSSFFFFYFFPSPTSFHRGVKKKRKEKKVLLLLTRPTLQTCLFLPFHLACLRNDRPTFCRDFLSFTFLLSFSLERHSPSLHISTFLLRTWIKLVKIERKKERRERGEREN